MQKIDILKIYQRKQALIVDDFPDMRGSIRRMLVNFGISRIETASTGDEAITHCENHKFDIILCDYNLGEGKNGQQILEELRYRKLLKESTAYMMITAETTKAMVFGALEYQPDDYLTKPFTQTVLQKRLDRVMLEKETLNDINRAVDKGDYALAIALCDDHIAAGDRYAQKCYRTKARCFLLQKKYADARAIYEEVLRERPLEWAQIGLGQCMLEMGDLHEAEKLFQQLVDQNCLCLEVYDFLAEVRSRLGDIVGAQHLLEYASDISPNAILRQQQLAKLSEHNGDWERAEKAHRKIIRLGANSCYESPDNYFNLVRCIAAQMRDGETLEARRIKDAEEVLERARRRYRDDADIRLRTDLLSAALYAEAGQDDEAERRLAALAPKLDPETLLDSPEVALELARSRHAMGDRDAAQQLLRDLAERYPDDDTIGEAIDRVSDEPLSRKGKENAVELNRHGKELLSGQDYTQAITLFGEALRHYPNNIAVKLNLLLALIREMERTGSNDAQLTRAEQIIHSIDTLQEDHPLYDRFHTLWDYVDQLREDFEEEYDDE